MFKRYCIYYLLKKCYPYPHHFFCLATGIRIIIIITTPFISLVICYLNR